MKYTSIQVEFVTSPKALVLTINTDDFSGERNPNCDRLYDDLCAAVDDALDRGDVRLSKGGTHDQFSTVVVDLTPVRVGGEALVATLGRARWYVISRKRTFAICGNQCGLAVPGGESAIAATSTDRDTFLRSLAGPVSSPVAAGTDS